MDYKDSQTNGKLPGGVGEKEESRKKGILPTFGASMGEDKSVGNAARVICASEGWPGIFSKRFA